MSIQVGVNFNGGPGISVVQGADQTILLSYFNAVTMTPINLNSFGGTIGTINLPLQGGGSIKRTNGLVTVPYTDVNLPGFPPPINTISFTDHGFVTGDPITVAPLAGGTLPGGGLAIDTPYTINVLDVNTFQFLTALGAVVPLTSQGTIGFTIFNAVDLIVPSGDLGQVQLTLRAAVAQAVNAALAQNFQCGYVLNGLTVLLVIQNQLDCLSQPVP